MSDTRGVLVWMWRFLRWPVVGLAAVSAFLLGRAGFESALDLGGPDSSYLALQLFTLESGAVALGDIPWQLQVARVLAPLTTATALVAGLVAVFRFEIEELRLRRMKDHVVVAGLGRRGSVLAVELKAAGYRVVGIEPNPDPARMSTLRYWKIPMVHGDARQVETLRRARVPRASHLIAVTESDQANADIALTAGSEARLSRARPLMCHAHILDPELCVLLREEELAAGSKPGFRLDFFNVYDQAIRTWQESRPPFGPEGRAHVLVVGLNALGQSVVTETARNWIRSGGEPGGLRMTVVDEAAESIVQQLSRRFPRLSQAVRLDVVAVDPCHLSGSDLPADPTGAYVCVDDDSTALEVGLMLRRFLPPLSGPIVVQLNESHGLAGLLERSGNEEIAPLSLFEQAMRPEALLGGTYEVLARQIHALYVAEQMEAGAHAEGNLSMVPWSDLSDSLKESNRDQSAHIGTKLGAIGCDIAPVSDLEAGGFEFTGDELEMLAELEHERWVYQRRREGWKAGPKDVAKSRTPHLAPWSELSEEVKDLDRRAVMHIPALLADAGYQIVRRPLRGR